jgi:hypothetical protein
MTILQEYKGKFHVNLPTVYVDKKKWKKGERVMWGFDQDGDLKLTDTK